MTNGLKSVIPGLTFLEAKDLLTNLGKESVKTKSVLYIANLAKKTYLIDKSFKSIVENESMKKYITKSTLNVARKIADLPEEISLYIDWGSNQKGNFGLKFLDAGNYYSRIKNPDHQKKLLDVHIGYQLNREELMKLVTFIQGNPDKINEIESYVNKFFSRSGHPTYSLFMGNLISNKTNEENIIKFIENIYPSVKEVDYAIKCSNGKYVIKGKRNIINNLKRDFRTIDNDIYQFTLKS